MPTEASYPWLDDPGSSWFARQGKGWVIALAKDVAKSLKRLHPEVSIWSRGACHETSSGGWSVDLGEVRLSGSLALELWVDRYLDGRTPRVWAGFSGREKAVGHLAKLSLVHTIQRSLVASPATESRGVLHLKQPPKGILGPVYLDIADNEETGSREFQIGKYFTHSVRRDVAARGRIAAAVAQHLGEALSSIRESRRQEKTRKTARGAEGQEDDALAALQERLHAGSAGQGYTVDPEVRVAIERYAEAKVKEQLKTEGWKIASVRQSCSYDFHCTRDKKTLMVEVKGTQSDGEWVLVTPNEVALFKQFPGESRLYVVSNIKATKSHGLQVTGGITRAYDGKAVARGQFVSQAYRYYPKTTELADPFPRLLSPRRTPARG